MFEEMVGKLTSRIQKQGTNMRRALQEPGLNLAIGLHSHFRLQVTHMCHWDIDSE